MKLNSRIIISVSTFLAITAWAAPQYQVNVGQTVDITEHGQCRRVTNASAPLPIFISTNSAGEWSNFYTSASIPGVSIGSCATCPALTRPDNQCSFPASSPGQANGWCGTGYTTCECMKTCNSDGSWGAEFGVGCVPDGNLCP